jgi:cytochrome c peroxidase
MRPGLRGDELNSRSARPLLLACVLVIAAAVAAVTVTRAGMRSAKAAGDGFVLNERCPPGFELVAGGTCGLRDLYQFYDSLQDRGVGGTRTSLPQQRDGFRPEQIDLGRYLFFDPILSGDGTLSCGSCHRPDRGFADGKPRSIGIHGQDAGRAAPTLWNVAFLQSFFWDARASSLEAQAQGPLFSPLEMGNEPARLLRSLNASSTYRRLFRQAFPDGDDTINAAQVYTALAAFQTTLISLNSRYDRYAHGYAAALNERELAGLNVFRSFVARCAECHTPPLFTNGQVAVIGAPEPAGHPFDAGAERTFHAAKLRGGFKVPTLRNIARTAPYMHSGVFGTLRETVEFYNKGRGNAVPPGETLYLHWHISSPDLTETEVDLLVDFLQTLTDETFTPEIPRRVPSGLPPLDNPKESRT